MFTCKLQSIHVCDLSVTIKNERVLKVTAPVALSYVTHMDTICKIIWLQYGVSCGLHPRPHMAGI